MHQTRIGISSYSYTYAVGFPGFEPPHPFTPFDLVNRAAELNVSVVQIADNCPLDALSDEDLHRLYDEAVCKRVQIEVGTRGIGTENLLRYIGIAKTLHSPILRVVIDTKTHHPEFEEIVRLLRSALPVLETAGICLGIENHDRFQAATFAQILSTLNSPYVGIVLDTVNSFACQENTMQVLDALGRYTVNFHAKDFTIRRVENSMGLLVTGTVAGEGMLDIPAVWNRLSTEAQCDYSTILELWMAPKDSVGETLQQEDLWVRQSIENLNSMLSNPDRNKKTGGKSNV